MNDLINCTFAISCILLFLVSGCTHLIIPSAVPTIHDYNDLSLKGVSLTLINAEKDSADFLIVASESMGKFIGNKRRWMGTFVEALSRELINHGAAVSNDASSKLYLSMPSIKGISGYQLIRFKVRIVASLDSEWSKAFEGEAAASVYGSGLGFYGAAKTGRKAASYVLAEIINIMLSDDEFLAHLKKE